MCAYVCMCVCVVRAPECKLGLVGQWQVCVCRGGDGQGMERVRRSS